MQGVTLRETRRGYAETPPDRCEGCGEVFAPRKVLVGVKHCQCAEVRFHRSFHCRRCGADTFVPALGPQCRAVSFAARVVTGEGRWARQAVDVDGEADTDDVGDADPTVTASVIAAQNDSDQSSPDSRGEQ